MFAGLTYFDFHQRVFSLIAIFAAPTVQIAEAIKTLDMSLPSYDDVKSYKASVENVKSLSVTPPTKSSTSSTSQDKKAKINMDAEEKNSGGFNAASFLPSLGKQGPKTSPEGYTF